jgi:hypothetical protein
MRKYLLIIISLQTKFLSRDTIPFKNLVKFLKCYNRFCSGIEEQKCGSGKQWLQAKTSSTGEHW